ncbi:MAG: exonuclease subunit SbcD [Thermoguttaceae bacterium]|nr:exonuclease subunit SbcD [Thermoguttaceae bacterium]
MKLLHTSDWHLGNQFNKSENRDEEFKKFFDWILDQVESEGVDLLLIAGDIFDSPNPSNDTVKQYYKFIGRLSRTGCRHLVIVGGNHDSANRLDAPNDVYDIIDQLKIRVIGGIDPENLAREVIVLADEKGVPEAVVCAVPYIPERLLRTVQPGETAEEKIAKAREGLKKHYDEVGALAEAERARIKDEYGKEVPLIVTGHLFVQGSEKYRSEDDGVRDLTIGGLDAAPPDTFPRGADYIALGHIHRAYPVENNDRIRYSGSIVPLGFDEAEYEKKICLAEFHGREAVVRDVDIPRFRPIKTIAAPTPDEIFAAIDAFDAECGDRTGYFKAVNTGDFVPGLHRKITEYTKGKKPVCCGTINKNSRAAVGMIAAYEDESLDDLTERDVFCRRMDDKKISPEKRKEFLFLFNELIDEIDAEAAQNN